MQKKIIINSPPNDNFGKLALVIDFNAEGIIFSGLVEFSKPRQIIPDEIKHSIKFAYNDNGNWENPEIKCDRYELDANGDLVLKRHDIIDCGLNHDQIQIALARILLEKTSPYINEPEASYPLYVEYDDFIAGRIVLGDTVSMSTASVASTFTIDSSGPSQ